MTASKNKSSSFFLQIYIKPKIIYCTKYLICLPINILCPIFGIHNSLAAVKPVITGEHITEGNGKKEIRHTVIAKQFKTDKQRSNRAVSNAAENRSHSYCRTKGR